MKRELCVFVQRVVLYPLAPHRAGAGAALSAGDIGADGTVDPAALDQVFNWQYGRGAPAVVFLLFPMLFIPMLSVFVSQSLGKDEAFRLPRWTKLLYIPTLLLLLLVLTNDLHRQVFSFPSGVLSDGEYRYEKLNRLLLQCFLKSLPHFCCLFWAERMA